MSNPQSRFIQMYFSYFFNKTIKTVFPRIKHPQNHENSRPGSYLSF